MFHRHPTYIAPPPKFLHEVINQSWFHILFTMAQRDVVQLADLGFWSVGGGAKILC